MAQSPPYRCFLLLLQQHIIITVVGILIIIVLSPSPFFFHFLLFYIIIMLHSNSALKFKFGYHIGNLNQLQYAQGNYYTKYEIYYCSILPLPPKESIIARLCSRTPAKINYTKYYTTVNEDHLVCLSV